MDRKLSVAFVCLCFLTVVLLGVVPSQSQATDFCLTTVVSTESFNESQYPSLALDFDGNLHVAWADLTDYNGSDTDWDIFYKAKINGTWTATEVVSTESTDNSLYPSLAVDANGNVYVAWQDWTNYNGSGSDLDIFYKARINGTWTVTEVVSTESTTYSQDPVLAVDLNGNVHVAWQDWTNYNGSGSSDPDIFYKARINGTWTVTEVVSTDSTVDSRYPSLAVDVNGNVYVAWDDKTDYLGCGTDFDIFYKAKINGTWTVTEVVSTESTGSSQVPSLAVDFDGNLHVAWRDTTNYNGCGGDYDIFYKAKINGNWTVTEVISTESTGGSYVPSIAVDISGNVYVAWEDETNYNGSGPDRDIFYKARINGSWTVTEVVSTESTGGSQYPSLAVDVNGRVHVVWQDSTDYNGSGVDSDILYSGVNEVANAGEDQTVNEGTTVTFNGSASIGTSYNPISNYTWTFTYNGTTVTLFNISPSFLFHIPDIYVVTLNVTYDSGIWKTDSMTVTVNDITDPVADAGINQTVNEGTMVTFNGSASYDAAGITNYTWAFTYNGSQVTLYGASPTHNFSIPGNYTVTLTVKDPADNAGMDTMMVNVTNLNPVAHAGVDQMVNEGTIVTFNGSASYDLLGISNYTWTFTYNGSTITLYDVAPQFNFSIPGNYTVTLTVKDAGENSATDTMFVNVTDLNPIANAGVDQTVDEGTMVTFNGSASYDSLGISNYTWNFTYDGETETLYGVSPTFNFSISDNYTVTLTVKDAANNIGTDTIMVNVTDLNPVADAGIDQTVDEGTMVTFNGSASYDLSGITNYTWTFTYNGSQVTLYGVSPTQNFSIPGNYTVTLTVKDPANNTGIDTMMVNITDLIPVADGGANQTVDQGTVVTFDGSDSNDAFGIVNYTWTFTYNGSQVTLYGVSPTYNFSTPGVYVVTLNVTDAAGNWDADTLTVNVNFLLHIGPITDANGNPLSGLNVTLTLGDQEYNGTTDSEGNVTIILPGSTVGAEATLTISGEGLQTVTTNLLILQSLSQEDLVFVISEAGSENDALTYVIGVVVLLLLSAVYLMYRKNRVV